MSTGVFDGLKSALSADEVVDNPFARYGLTENPFPPSTVTQDAVLWNQEAVREALDRKLEEFLLRDHSTSGFLLSGGNRTGKSTLLRYYRRELRDVFTGVPARRSALVVYLVASGQRFMDDFQQIIRELRSSPLGPPRKDALASLVDWFRGEDASKGQGPPAPDRLAVVGPGDLRRALEVLVHSQADLGVPEQTAMRDRFWVWLSGGRVYRDDLRLLGIEERIETAGQAVRCLRYLIRALRAAGLLGGAVVMVDEIEQLWAATPRARHQYLQDWRHMLDEVDQGLFLILASADGPAADLRTQYPALTGRLEGAAEPSVLGLVSSDREAWECAQMFLDAARVQGEARGLRLDRDLPALVTADDVRSAFARVARDAGRVATGPLLDDLHRVAEERAARGV